MKRASLSWFYQQKNTNKGRTLLSKLIGYKVKLCRTGSNLDKDGIAVKPTPRNKSSVKRFDLINSNKKYARSTKGYGKEFPEHSKRVNMLGYHIGSSKRSDKITLQSCMGYYPHIYYQNEWRPLYFKAFYGFYGALKDIVFWCYTSKKNRPRDFSIVRAYEKTHLELIGGPEDLPSKAERESRLPSPIVTHSPKYSREDIERIIKNTETALARQTNKIGKTIYTKKLEKFKAMEANYEI
jgi:hypothetical protein